MNDTFAGMLGLPRESNASLSAPGAVAPTSFVVRHEERILMAEELPMQICARENRKVLEFAETIERTAIDVFQAARSRYSFVLLDLTMPHLDGEETFRHLRHLHHGVRVVLMSGFTEHDAVSRFAGKGLAGFVQKPFSMTMLREVVLAATLSG